MKPSELDALNREYQEFERRLRKLGVRSLFFVGQDGAGHAVVLTPYPAEEVRGHAARVFYLMSDSDRTKAAHARGPDKHDEPS